MTALAAYQADPLNRYLDFSLIVPQSAELLNGAKQPEAAFAVADSATKQFPQSVAAWLVLAFVAHASGHDEVALSAARRTIELDPNNRSVRDLIAKLTKER